MRLPILLLMTMAAVSCGGGSEDAADAPPQAPAASAPPRAPRPPAFPAADQFRVGETVTLRASSGAPAECNKLYLQDRVVAIVQEYVHAGRGAAALRCLGGAWATPATPTPSELQAVGATLDGRLAPEYEGLSVAADGAVTFTELDLANRASGVSFAGRWAAYVATANEAAAAGGGRQADVIGMVYDIPARAPLQQFLLGTCRLSGTAEAVLTLATPEWGSDGRSVVFHGDADRCSFDEVEAHPE
jgi:hypothetical protein